RNAYADIGNPNETVFTIPPSALRNIGDELLERNISWKYYGDQWNAYVANPDANYVQPNNLYCNICNPFQYSTSIMTNAAVRTAHLKDTADLCADIKKGDLPAVSFVKPSGWVDGHPASSKLNLFEGFVKYIVNAVKANPKLWNDTRSSPPLTRAAAITIPATFRRSTSSAMEPEFRRLWSHASLNAGTFPTCTRITSRC